MLKMNFSRLERRIIHLLTKNYDSLKEKQFISNDELFILPYSPDVIMQQLYTITTIFVGIEEEDTFTNVTVVSKISKTKDGYYYELSEHILPYLYQFSNLEITGKFSLKYATPLYEYLKKYVGEEITIEVDNLKEIMQMPLNYRSTYVKNYINKIGEELKESSDIKISKITPNREIKANGSKRIRAFKIKIYTNAQ